MGTSEKLSAVSTSPVGRGLSRVLGSWAGHLCGRDLGLGVSHGVPGGGRLASDSWVNGDSMSGRCKAEFERGCLPSHQV